MILLLTWLDENSRTSQEKVRLPYSYALNFVDISPGTLGLIIPPLNFAAQPSVSVKVRQHGPAIERLHRTAIAMWKLLVARKNGAKVVNLFA